MVTKETKPKLYEQSDFSSLCQIWQEKKPVAMVSTDNCSHNGDKLYAAISAFAAWTRKQKAEEGFEEYINSDKSFFLHGADR